MAPSGNKSSRIASNRRALHDYFVLERLEAGIELRGTEVKSIRAGHISLVGSFGRIENDDVVLFGVNVTPYEFGNRFNHPADRPRRLLLHHREIRKIRAQIEKKGLSLIPLSVYLKRGLIKVELGICKGKQLYDKRETLRKKTADREAARAMANSGRR